MEASLNGCGKMLDQMNALHTTFAPQPEAEYVGHGRTTFSLHSRSINLSDFPLSSSCTQLAQSSRITRYGISTNRS